jgi:hypothetical protein
MIVNDNNTISQFSDYLIFVDESGSPSMGGNIDPQYPLFVLAFLIVKKQDYAQIICPMLQTFKFQHFGHDQIILHEREIRKDLGSFAFLKTYAIKQAFLNELTTLIEQLPLQLCCIVINKTEHQAKYTTPENPYHLGLEFGLERIRGFLQQQGAAHTAHVVVECRGKKEDDELELEFRRICDGANFKSEKMTFEIVFANKKSNSAGLQLADLIARPAGMSVIKPNQPNRAMDIIRKKLISMNGKTKGWGLKIFP